MSNETVSDEFTKTKYIEAVKAPRDYLDLFLVFLDPNSEIKKDFNALILKKIITEEEILQLQLKCMFREFKENARRREEIERELRYTDLKTKLLMLNEKLNADLKQADIDPAILSLKADITRLQTQAANMASQYLQLTQRQLQLHQQWNQAHLANANAYISKLAKYLYKRQDKLFDVNGNPINLTEAKQHQLAMAFVPPSPIIISDVLSHRLTEEHLDNMKKVKKAVSGFNANMGVLNFAKCLNGDEKQLLLEGDEAIDRLKYADNLAVELAIHELVKNLKREFRDEKHMESGFAKNLAKELVTFVRSKIKIKDYALQFLRNKKQAAVNLGNEFLQSNPQFLNYFKAEDIYDMVLEIAKKKPEFPKSIKNLDGILQETLDIKKIKDEIPDNFNRILVQIKDKKKELDLKVQAQVTYQNEPRPQD